MHKCEQADCKHKDVEYCAKCKNCYCKVCDFTWEEPCKKNHTWPYTRWQYYTSPTYAIGTAASPGQPTLDPTYITCSHTNVDIK